MNVLLLSHLLAFGGVEQHALNLQAGLARAGHYCTVAGLARYQEVFRLVEWSQSPEPLLAEDVQVLLGRQRFDVVNVQCPFPPEVAEKISVPMVCTAHGASSFEEGIPLQCKVLVVMDGRYLETGRETGLPVRHIRNGIDLDRFRMAPMGGRAETLAYFGRIIPVKTTAAQQVQAVHPVDYFGAGEVTAAENATAYGPSRAEDVGQWFKVVTATGIAAVEMMACGALLLAPPASEKTFRQLANASYSIEVNYGPNGNGNALEDYERLAGLPRAAADSLAAWQRSWVERTHDADDMTHLFLEVYEEAL